ncbi:MAG TPA: CmcJ/NvfI family oxidoreductase [Myxococcota bacterium]|nr:CmcJ/NvfI family oxidoreductase [Myxococcota bacterium]
MSLDLPTVETTLFYLLPSAEKPRSYTFEPPPGVPRRSGKPDARAVRIADARKLPEPATLDREGFALVPHATAVRDFLDDAELRAVYEREVEALIRSVTGAEKVVVFDHTRRSGCPDQRAETGAREPVRSVHNDYTVWSGKRRVSDHLASDEAALRLGRRHAVINVWRSMAAPVEADPLAVCDARSIRADDLVATDLVYPDRVGEVYSVRYNPAHRWYYYSKLRRDEALLIKTYDSLEDGTARFSAHSAFEDPTTSEFAPPRQSIETRALVFWR